MPLTNPNQSDASPSSSPRVAPLEDVLGSFSYRSQIHTSTYRSAPPPRPPVQAVPLSFQGARPTVFPPFKGSPFHVETFLCLHRLRPKDDQVTFLLPTIHDPGDLSVLFTQGDHAPLHDGDKPFSGTLVSNVWLHQVFFEVTRF